MNAFTIVVLGALSLVAGALLFAALTVWPTMLVLGAMHHSDGLSGIPALGFWQTFGALFLISVVGSAFGGSSALTIKKG